MDREARSSTQQSLDMLDLAIEKTEQGIAMKDVLGNDEKNELKVARPVFDQKQNFWYVGTPPALEEPLVEFKPEAHLGKMPWELVASGTSEQLVFDPKLNFWYAKKAEEKKDEEAEAAAIREKMEKEGRAIVEEEKAKANCVFNFVSRFSISTFRSSWRRRRERRRRPLSTSR